MQFINDQIDDSWFFDDDFFCAVFHSLISSLHLSLNQYLFWSAFS